MNIKHNRKGKFFKVVLYIVFFALYSAKLYAGDEDADFAALQTWVEGLSEGTLGQIIATVSLLGSAVVIGATQSIKPAMIPLSISGMLFFGPDVVNGIVAATI